MSRVIDVPSQLGQYMLKGWVLTDIACPKCRIPMMRSPRGITPVVEFCVKCEDESHQPQPSEQRTPTSIASSDANTSSSLIMSRTSSPPTEISSSLSSPTFALMEDTEETLRRRQQSDMAAAELGNRLLKGWAMLADECPNTTCFGVPLVRPPKSGGGKDPRKECVICNTVYVDEKEVNGWGRLVSIESSKQPSVVSDSNLPAAGPSTSYSLNDKGKGPIPDKALLPSSTSPQKHAIPLEPISDPLWNLETDKRDQSTLPGSTTMAVLEASSRSLELALHALSDRLTSLAGGQMPLDPLSISQTAETVTKVTLALGQIKQLQWSERQAYGP